MRVDAFHSLEGDPIKGVDSLVLSSHHQSERLGLDVHREQSLSRSAQVSNLGPGVMSHCFGKEVLSIPSTADPLAIVGPGLSSDLARKKNMILGDKELFLLCPIGEHSQSTLLISSRHHVAIGRVLDCGHLVNEVCVDYALQRLVQVSDHHIVLTRIDEVSLSRVQPPLHLEASPGRRSWSKYSLEGVR